MDKLYVIKVASHRGFINEIRDVSKRQNMAKYAYYTFFSYKHNIKKIKTFFFCRGSRFGIQGLKPDPDPEKFEYRIRIHIQAKNIYS